VADLTITAASVIAGSGTIERGTAGATITAGQVVYKSAGKYQLADNDSATAAAKSPRGIALNGGSDGQPMSIMTSGSITIGATLTAGTAYYLSSTAGGICPLADVISGDNVVLLGVASSTTVLKLNITDSGVTLA
jgi:hypothetical protein